MKGRTVDRLQLLRTSASARFLQKFMDDRALTLASLLAWGILNTFLPLLLGILAVLGLLLGDLPAVAAVEQQLLALLPAEASAFVSDSIEAFERAAGGAGLVSLGFLLFNGSNFFVTLESVFDLVYHVPERNLIVQRIVSFGALFITIILAVLTTAAAAAGGAFGQTVADLLPGLGNALYRGVGTTVSLLGLGATFFLMYWRLPNKPHSALGALPGTVVGSVLFLLLLRVFPLYVSLFGEGFNAFAAFGSVLLFMFWLYIVGVVLAGGAVLNAFLEDPHGSVTQSSLVARARIGQLELPANSLAPEATRTESE